MMDFFTYKSGRLFAEETDVSAVAEEVGTPLFVYSKRTVELHLARLQAAFAPLEPIICYSIKANGNLGLLKVCVENGVGFDIVSGGELYRALAAGGDASKIVFAGVGKTDGEIFQALDAGILFFNVESQDELAAIDRVASASKRRARVCLRVNPDVDAHTHEYITTARRHNKFGLTIDVARSLAAAWSEYPSCDLVGVDMHIGSQITDTEPYRMAIERLLDLKDNLAAHGHAIRYFDIGGGFGIFYQGNEAATAAEFADVIIPLLRDSGLKTVIEPGRFVVGNAGILLARVLYVKRQGDKRFVIVDAGMNDLLRPSFYGSYHKIWPAETHMPFSADESLDTPPADVVGPICESGDFLAKERPLPLVERGALLAVFGAGAYGMTMSSNYNARPRAAEVLVDGDSWKLVRRRETYEDLVGPELDGI